MQQQLSRPVAFVNVRRYYRGGTRIRPVALPERDLVYVKNAKTGCSTTFAWLHWIRTGRGAPKRLHLNVDADQPSDIGWPKVLAMLSGEAFRFTFVREPVARFESAYRQKVTEWPGAANGPSPAALQLQQVLGVPRATTLTPEQVVDALEQLEPVEMDNHWRPQYLNLMHPWVEYDFVGRLESMGADLARLSERLGLPEMPPVATINKTSGAPVLAQRPDLRARVEALYARDAEIYGYA